MARRSLLPGLVALALLATAPVAAGHELRHARSSLAALPAMPASAMAPDAPDLRISLPSVPYSGQVAPVYVDAFEQEGRLLYRFDSMIHNTGGVLDVYGNADGVWQKVWPGGQPSEAPHPEQPAPGSADDRFDDGARFAYVFEDTHDHWHFFSAARYSLLVPGAAARVSDKVGFCLFDSFGSPGGETWWFPWDAPGSSTWCRFDAPSSSFVRMGLSSGATDRYSSQREFQYVDVTGLAPGEYVLRAQANPSGHLVEADPTDDVHEEVRVIPGVVADGASLATGAGAAASVDVAARVVAPEIPARLSASCEARAAIESCYRRITASSPLSYAVASGPAHGVATFEGSRLTYTPAAGFSGTDELTYTATDGRGLVSAPATVRVEVAPAPSANGGAGAGAAPPGVSPVVERRRMLRIGRVRRVGSRRLAVRLLCRPAAASRCSGRLTARIAGRRVGRTRFAGLGAGRSRVVVVRLRRSSVGRRVVLRAVVRDGAGSGVVARRVLQGS